MEDVLKSSLDVFDQSLLSNGKNETELAQFTDEHQQTLIDQFQSLVMKLKDNISSQKKVQAQITKDTNDNAAKETVKDPKPSAGNIAGIVENVMKDIKQEADSLETKMKHETFREGANSSKSTIETVVKIDEDKVRSRVFCAFVDQHVLILYGS
jgi:hypothetical protein